MKHRLIAGRRESYVDQPTQRTKEFGHSIGRVSTGKADKLQESKEVRHDNENRKYFSYYADSKQVMSSEGRFW